MTQVSDVEAAVKLMAIEHGLEAFDERAYNQAIALGVACLGLGRQLAAADVTAEGEHHPSAIIAPVAAAFRVAAHVAERGRFQGGPEATGRRTRPGEGVANPGRSQAGSGRL